MARPRVATVLSAREWESMFVQAARTSGLVRLIARAYEPADLDRPELDIIVAGAETAWVTPAAIKRWRERGLGVLGLHPPLDRPGRRLLTVGGADEVLPDTTPPERILNIVRTMGRPAPGPTEVGRPIAVTGARGAPGISEIALAIAWGLAEDHRTLLIDLDREGPSLSVRLGVKPAPDVAQAADEIMLSGCFPEEVRHSGPLFLLSGPPPHRWGPLSPSLINEVIQAAGSSYRGIVIDLGSGRAGDALLYGADPLVFVCEATPKGLIRAATAVENWNAPPPALVLNRVPPEDRGEAVRAARRWLGLEPQVVIPCLTDVSRAARRAKPPVAELVRMVAELRNPTRLE